MRPALSYDDICKEIAQRNYGDYPQDPPPGPNPKVVMIGLLFAPPSAPLAKAEIVERLQDYDCWSGRHIDFFCVGYGIGDAAPGYIRIGHTSWTYSSTEFDMVKRQIESRSRWEYSGEVDLVLTNAHYDHDKRSVFLDFRKAVVCQLDAMKKDNAVLSVASFFQDVFRYAESASGDDPTWGFSDAQGIRIAGPGLLRFVLALLPEYLRKLGEEARKAANFAVKDISVQS